MIHFRATDVKCVIYCILSARLQAEALVPQPAYGYHTTPAKSQRNNNTHRTRTIQPINYQDDARSNKHKINLIAIYYVLTSETCRALNKEIIKQVTSSWSLFVQN